VLPRARRACSAPSCRRVRKSVHAARWYSWSSPPIRSRLCTWPRRSSPTRVTLADGPGGSRAMPGADGAGCSAAERSGGPAPSDHGQRSAASPGIRRGQYGSTARRRRWRSAPGRRDEHLGALRAEHLVQPAAELRIAVADNNAHPPARSSSTESRLRACWTTRRRWGWLSPRQMHPAGGRFDAGIAGPVCISSSPGWPATLQPAGLLAPWCLAAPAPGCGSHLDQLQVPRFLGCAPTWKALDAAVVRPPYHSRSCWRRPLPLRMRSCEGVPVLAARPPRPRP